MSSSLGRWCRKPFVIRIFAVTACAVALKLFYSTAGVNQLRWILAPTTLLVEFISGSRFEFESYAGYVSEDRGFVIAASCAGVNFLIAAFLMLTLSRAWKDRARKVAWYRSWGSIALAAAIAYLTTLLANAVRIIVALQLRGASSEVAGLTPNEVHRVEGILIYFGFLLLLFVASEELSEEVRVLSKGLPHSLARYCFPLSIYYGITLAVPIAAGAFRNQPASYGWWEHAGFVLVTPLFLLLLPIAIQIVRMMKRGRAKGFRATATSSGG